MADIVAAWNWFASQSLVVEAIVTVGVLNVLIAGFKAMGWTYLADECQKIENAIAAMIAAAKGSFMLMFQRPDATLPPKA